jgi:hypothetical protein
LQKAVKNSSDFQKFSNLVKNLAVTVANIGRSPNFASGIVIKELLKKLPEFLRLQWGQFLIQHNVDDADIFQFATWVRQQNEVTSKVEIGDDAKVSSQTEDVEEYRDSRQRDVPRSLRTCAVCQGVDHLPPKCDKFKKADNKQRWRISDKHRLCYCCLLVHSKGVCQSRKSCGVNGCTRFHHPLLHKDEVQHGDTMNINTDSSQALLRVVPIQIRAATVLNTFAICDEGSTNTLIDESMAEKIGADGPKLPYCCRWMDKTTKQFENSKKVSFEVAAASVNTKWHKVDGARTIPNLNLPRSTIDLEFLLKEYSYLPRDELEKIAGAKPMLLIGQDNQTLMVAREVIEPNPNGPMMTRTKLGWIVHGPGNHNGKNEATVNICCEEDVVEKFKPNENLEGMVSNLDHYKPEEKWKQLQKMGRSTEIINGRLGVDLQKQRVVLPFPESRSVAIRPLKFAERGLLEVDMESRCYVEMKKRIAEDLNDRLMTGPELVPSFFGMLWWFGFYVVAVPANIPGMRFSWMIGESTSRQHDVYKMREMTRDASSFIAQSVECYRRWCFGDECPNAVRTSSAVENLDVNRVQNWRSESASADGPSFLVEKDEDWSKEVYERMPAEPVDRALTWKTILRAVA